MDLFYNADVVIADLSDRLTQRAIFYQLGVRDSFNRKACVITVESSEDAYVQQLSAVSDYSIAPYTTVGGECFDTTDSALPFGDKLLQLLRPLQTEVMAQLRSSVPEVCAFLFIFLK